MIKLQGSEKQIKWAEQLLQGFDNGVNYIIENAKEAVEIAIDEEDYSLEEGTNILQKGLMEIETYKNKVLQLESAGDVISELKEIVKNDCIKTSKNIQYRVEKLKYASELIDNIIIYL